jgi:hypothetical protein
MEDGRWKGGGWGGVGWGGVGWGVANRYISAEQLTTDAKLAVFLAVCGLIRYKLKDDGHISLQFLKSTVAPKMH